MANGKDAENCAQRYIESRAKITVLFILPDCEDYLNDLGWNSVNWMSKFDRKRH
jgi:hypothetical protein